jgi:hypothetical protein
MPGRSRRYANELGRLAVWMTDTNSPTLTAFSPCEGVNPKTTSMATKCSKALMMWKPIEGA